VGLKAVEPMATTSTDVSHPQKDLFAGIRAGISLKPVEALPKTTADDEDERNQSPTSALLAKLQARKKQCLERQQQGSNAGPVEPEDDDW
jgi:hypothetical protein